MKRCPTCLRVYQDDSVRFCRVDGTILSGITSESQNTLLKLPRREGQVTETRGLQEQSPKLAQITFDEAIEEYPAWFPNGVEILFSRERAGLRKIFRKNLSTGEETQVTKGDFDEIQPTCSRDGRMVLFVRSREPHLKLEPGDVFGVFSGGDIWAMD